VRHQETWMLRIRALPPRPESRGFTRIWMKILVTGGAGFIGSNLCENLFGLGHTVVSLDNYSTGSVSNHISGVLYVRGDTKDIFQHITDNDFDLIYHLGEYSRVEKSYNDLDTVLEYNLYSINTIIKFAKQCGAKLIYSASSTKFCEQGGALSPYAWTKSVNVDYVKNYANWYGLDFAITYFYNVFGQREISSGEYSTVVAKFLKIKRDGGTKLPVRLPGSQRRNFTHINDTVDGLILVGMKGQGDGYGIGSPESYSVLELAEMIGLEPELLPEVKGNRTGAQVMSEKTIALGWSPKHNLKEYITSCLN
jgi:UDP-glucose 4-epimerase